EEVLRGSGRGEAEMVLAVLAPGAGTPDEPEPVVKILHEHIFRRRDVLADEPPQAPPACFFHERVEQKVFNSPADDTAAHQPRVDAQSIWRRCVLHGHEYRHKAVVSETIGQAESQAYRGGIVRQ